MNRENSDHGPPAQSTVPLGQQLADNWPLLLIAGVVIMFVIYTGWGLYEVINMPKAELP